MEDVMDKARVMKDFKLTEAEYSKIDEMTTWPNNYGEHRKAQYIRRVAYKASVEGLRPEAYLIYKRARKALLSER
jgi:hypothetical protein